MNNSEERKIRLEDTVIFEEEAIAELSPEDFGEIRAFTPDGEEIPIAEK